MMCVNGINDSFSQIMEHLPRPNLEPLYSHHRQLPKAERFSKLSSQCLYALQQDPAEQSDPRSLEWFAADQGAAYRSSFATILPDIEDFLEAQKLIDKVRNQKRRALN